jgi:uncharacterized protein YciI
MFVVMVKYLKPLTEIDAHLEAHRRFLDQGYASGYLVASGPRVPRTGGVLLAKAPSKEHLWAYLNEDPFSKAGLTSYEVFEFTPVKSDPRFQAILESGFAG